MEWNNSRKDRFEQDVHDGKICIATDGSNYKNEGAYAWGIANEEGEFYVKGKGRIACAKDDSSSLRPEMIAIISAMKYLNACSKEESQRGTVVGKRKKISIYTDSEVSIKCMNNSCYPSTKNAFESNMDVKLELKHLLRTSQYQYELLHVRAHQDEVKPYEELTIAERMNCDIDKLAGSVYEDERCGNHNEIVPFFPAQKCAIRLPFHAPTSNILDQIISFANGHDAEEQLATYWGMEKMWMCIIEWKGLRAAIRREKNAKKMSLSKVIHKQIPTMAMMKRNKLSNLDICHICEREIETWDHVYQCEGCEAKFERHKQLEMFKSKMKSMRTHPVLLQRLVAAILQYTQQYDFFEKSTFNNH